MTTYSVFPEANYITDKRTRIRIYSIRETFVACIDATWNGCIPSIYNYPYHDLVPSTSSSEYYLAFGLTSNIYTSMKILFLTASIVDEEAYLMIAIYTDSDNNKHILYKIGSPIDIPSTEKVWIVRRDGYVYYAEFPEDLSDFIRIGEADKMFIVGYDSNGNNPPIVAQAKCWPLILIGIAGMVTWGIIEWHKADNSKDVEEYAIDKQYKFYDKIYNDIKSGTIPSDVRDAFIGMLEGHFASNTITWSIPNGHTGYDDTWLDKIFGWLKSNWRTIVLGIASIIGIIILVTKLQIIKEILSSIIGWFKRR